MILTIFPRLNVVRDLILYIKPTPEDSQPLDMPMKEHSPSVGNEDIGLKFSNNRYPSKQMTPAALNVPFQNPSLWFSSYSCTGGTLIESIMPTLQESMDLSGPTMNTLSFKTNTALTCLYRHMYVLLSSIFRSLTNKVA